MGMELELELDLDEQTQTVVVEGNGDGASPSPELEMAIEQVGRKAPSLRAKDFRGPNGQEDALFSSTIRVYSAQEYKLEDIVTGISAVHTRLSESLGMIANEPQEYTVVKKPVEGFETKRVPWHLLNNPLGFIAPISRTVQVPVLSYIEDRVPVPRKQKDASDLKACILTGKQDLLKYYMLLQLKGDDAYRLRDSINLQMDNLADEMRSDLLAFQENEAYAKQQAKLRPILVTEFKSLKKSNERYPLLDKKLRQLDQSIGEAGCNMLLCWQRIEFKEQTGRLAGIYYKCLTEAINAVENAEDKVELTVDRIETLLDAIINGGDLMNILAGTVPEIQKMTDYFNASSEYMVGIAENTRKVNAYLDRSVKYDEQKISELDSQVQEMGHRFEQTVENARQWHKGYDKPFKEIAESSGHGLRQLR